jgi:hypothetical protein
VRGGRDGAEQQQSGGFPVHGSSLTRTGARCQHAAPERQLTG